MEIFLIYRTSIGTGDTGDIGKEECVDHSSEGDMYDEVEFVL